MKDVTPGIEETHTTSESIPDWLKVPSTSTNNSPVDSPKIYAVESIDAMNSSISSDMQTNPTIDDVPVTKEDIPNWLNTSSDIITPIESKNEIIETQAEETSIVENNKPINEVQPVLIPENSKTDDGIPEWIKNTSVIPENPALEVISSNTTKEDKLPDWLVNSLQSDVNPLPEIEETLAILPETKSENINILDLDSKEKNPAKKVPKKTKVTPVKKEEKSQ